MSERKSKPQPLETQREIIERVTSETKANRTYVERLRAQVREYERKTSKQNSYKPSNLDEGKSQQVQQPVAGNTRNGSTQPCWSCSWEIIISEAKRGSNVGCPNCGKSNCLITKLQQFNLEQGNIRWESCLCESCKQWIQYLSGEEKCPNCQKSIFFKHQDFQPADVAPTVQNRDNAIPLAQVEQTAKTVLADTRPMTYQCPRCSSAEIQRAQIGYMAGVSQVSGIGVGAGNQGELAVGSFGGSQQTLLSEYLSPPSKRPTILIVLITWVLTTIGFSLFLCIKNNDSADFELVFIAPIILPFYYSTMDDKSLFHMVVTVPTVLAVIWAFVNHDWNGREHPKLLEKYSRTWFCKRCGHAWLASK